MWTFAMCQTCDTPFRVFLSTVEDGRGKTCSRQCAKGLIGRRHGESSTRLHGIWCDMKSRCVCETSKAWEYYGGRGITVCQEWIESYESFRDWAMANGYAATLEIDRRDTNGNYEPSNCRWATRVQQMRNTRKRVNAKTSKYKGVSLHSQNKKWIAQVCGRASKRSSYAGSFRTELEAAREYDRIAIEEFGEFAKLNFPRKECVSR